MTNAITQLPRRLMSSSRAALETFLDPSWRRSNNGHIRNLMPRTEPILETIKTGAYPVAKFHRSDPGDVNMSDRQLAFLEALAVTAPIRRFLEVGVYYGVTTSVLAQYGATVAVDWFNGNQEANEGPWRAFGRDHARRVDGFRSTLDEAGVRQYVTVLTGNTHDVLPHLTNDQFGLVLVDGDHSEDGAYRDIKDVWDLIVPGGYLVLDDYGAALVEGRVVNDVERAWLRFAEDRPDAWRPHLLTPDPKGPPAKLVAVHK